MKTVVALRHVPHEGLGALTEALARAELPLQVVDLFRGEPLEFDPANLAGLIVMGGPMNVDEVDRYPFLALEVALLQRAIAASLPVLGICLGSQLLAKAAGARVYPNAIKEIGWYPLQVEPAAAEDPLFHDWPLESTVFQWHGDTFDLPSGAVWLARSALCRQQAFRVGSAAYGLQFHIEMTERMIDEWLCESGGCAEVAALDYIDPEEIRRRTPVELPALARRAAQTFDRFAALCRRRG
ncbi:MAG TPA: gamma-glutamyl-gamma-aminobutyrate hydrolase family protein [Pirellulales bacterium]|jgi:GMP synthase (glutamine-hydrolysing)|nr:gamma-glutamyl-gamma-aminobutyrate hydrolase family protein [Pirellulales bacterium]